MNRHIWSWPVALCLALLIVAAYLLSRYFGRGKLAVTVTHADRLELRRGAKTIASGAGPLLRTDFLPDGRYLLYASSNSGDWNALAVQIKVPPGRRETALTFTLEPSNAKGEKQAST